MKYPIGIQSFEKLREEGYDRSLSISSSLSWMVLPMRLFSR